jgi:aldehyde dehydrogenase (NAD+)
MTTVLHPGEVRSFDKLLIGGRWVQPSSDRRIASISPVTEEAITHVPEAQSADIDAAVAAARTAFDEGPWPRMAPVERAAALRRIRDEIDARIPELANAFTAEIGTPITLSEGFLGGALTMYSAAADALEHFPFEEDREGVGGTGWIIREPIGVVAAIVPWNAPVGNASIKLAPALASGCTVVLKPAPEGAANAMMLAEALEAAGLPDGVVSVVPAGREVGEHLVRHPGVDKVSFTGSTAAGKRVMSICSERIARVTLELGGKSPAIIADDVAVDDLVPGLVMNGIQHSGQVCAALTRILVPRRRHDEIVAALATEYRTLKVGDPFDRDTQIGPLVAERQRDAVEAKVQSAIDDGIQVVAGGRRPAAFERGWYFEPTLFAGVDNSSRIAQQEIFGPVQVVISFDDVEDAIRIANDTPYGLSGAVYANDPELAGYVARRVRTGQMWINSWGMCVTEPFGGYKQSGLGREGGAEGIVAYLETKFVGRSIPAAAPSLKPAP